MEFDIFEYATTREFGDIHLHVDNDVGLCAIIAIHNTNRGPALGGCRCIEYPSTNEAIYDAMRLARAMSYKSAVLGLPHGGGKAVLIKPQQIKDREQYFSAYAQFVESLRGRYITAVDSGTSPADMDVIKGQTKYVTSTSDQGNTSGYTARGVKIGIEAAVKFKLNAQSLKGVHVAIQGLGHVGFALAECLHEEGAVLSVTDTNKNLVREAVERFGATPVAPDAIFETKCDVIAPCALGAVINDDTIPKMNASIIAGAANNQLKTWEYGKYLHQREILYAPDYVINAGGLIYAAGLYDNANMNSIMGMIGNIGSSLTEIFSRSLSEDLPTSTIADKLANEKLQV